MATLVMDQVLQQTLDSAQAMSQLSLHERPCASAMTQLPDGRISLCPSSDYTFVSTTLHVIGGSATQLPLLDHFSPSQMPPKKRHRRSASVPEVTRSESRVRRRFVRHRQNSGLPHPIPVHPNVAGIAQPPLLTDVFGNHRSTSLPAVTSLGSSFPCQVPGSVPESSFRTVKVLTSVRPASDRDVAKPSVSSVSCTPVVQDEQRGSTGGVSLQQRKSAARCHSQPGALLTRKPRLKRRRDEFRPWLNFRKMRETAYRLEHGCCPRSQSSTYLTAGEDDSQDSSLAKHQLTGNFVGLSLSREATESGEQVMPSSHCELRPDDDVTGAMLALLDRMDGTDDEVAAINVGHEGPSAAVACSKKPVFDDNDNCISTSTPGSSTDDLDLDLIEQN